MTSFARLDGLASMDGSDCYTPQLQLMQRNLGIDSPQSFWRLFLALQRHSGSKGWQEGSQPFHTATRGKSDHQRSSHVQHCSTTASTRQAGRQEEEGGDRGCVEL